MRGVNFACWVVFIQMISGVKVVRGSDPPPPDCVIPDGYFDGFTVESNKRQPYYGYRCPLETTTVQVKKKQCMPRYCCQEPCICGNSNVEPDYMTCGNSTPPKTLSCYVENIGLETTLFGCCQGSGEDEFHVCSKAINCAVANGGCDQLCRHNDTTGKDYCACYPGYQRQLTNSDGTIKCRGDGPIPTPTSAPSTAATDASTTLTPASVVVVPSYFPVPYIIAIIVGVGLLLLLLLFLLLLALCCRRRQKKNAQVPPDSKAAVVCVTVEEMIGAKSVKVFGVKVDDDDKKVKGSETNRCIENEYSEDPVGRVASVHNDKIEGTYEEIPAKYEDCCETKYEEIPANYYEKSDA